MKPTVNLKLLVLLGIAIAFVVIFTIPRRPASTSSPEKYLAVKAAASSSSISKSCSGNKIPSSVAGALVHYATSKVTPQQSLMEISVSAAVLERRSPCNFLVFGLGYDSPMWAALNHGGRTIFIEESQDWIKDVTAKFPALEAYHAVYHTELREADELLELGRQAPECNDAGKGAEIRDSKCRLAMGDRLPEAYYEVEWDVVMIDAPTGWMPTMPGRMSPIYTVGSSARGRKGEGDTDVFIHDVDRAAEDKFSKEFLCEGYMKVQEGRLRHFVIPRHTSDMGTRFCP